MNIHQMKWIGGFICGIIVGVLLVLYFQFMERRDAEIMRLELRQDIAGTIYQLN